MPEPEQSTHLPSCCSRSAQAEQPPLPAQEGQVKDLSQTSLSRQFFTPHLSAPNEILPPDDRSLQGPGQVTTTARVSLAFCAAVLGARPVKRTTPFGRPPPQAASDRTSGIASAAVSLMDV